MLKIFKGVFLGCAVVKTSSSNVGGASSIPGQGVKIPHALWLKTQNLKQKQHCNKFKQKSGSHKKKKKKNIKKNFF